MNNVNINVQCECNHRRGLLYYAWPLAWGRPCRRCRRMMAGGIVVVPQMNMPVQTTTTTVTPAQCATSWQMQQQQQQPMPMPMQMQNTQMVSALPPKYDQVVAAN